MAKIQLVIKIDDKHYTDIKESEHCGNYSVLYALDAIRNGTPLPKGHGRLIDADKLKKVLKNHHGFLIDSWGGFSNMPVKEKARADEISNSIAEVMNSRTIIEAEEG